MIANSSEPRATIDSSAPTTSSGRRRGSRDVGTSQPTSTRAVATIGTLTKNTEPHQKCSSSQPLPTMPMAAPEPANPAQMAMARGRSSGGKTAARIDSVPGISSAAPRPWVARMAMRAPGSPAMVASSDIVPKIASPAISAPLRPKRSPTAPAVRSSPANTRA